MLLALLAVGATASPSFAQEVAIDLSAGSAVYEPLAAHVRASNVTASLRYERGDRAWIFGSGGVPLRTGDSSWVSAGAGGRLQRARATGIAPGLDLGGHGYVFRDPILAARGIGATVEALPFVALPAGPGQIEVRTGWRGHTLSFAGLHESRGAVEMGVRAAHGSAGLRLELDAKWVRTSDGGFPGGGAAVAYAGRPVQFWMRAGKWLDPVLDDVWWGAGVGVEVGARLTAWSRVWQDAPDPLFWNLPRRSWGVGLTYGVRHAPGSPRAVFQPAARDGDSVVIALPVSEVRAGALFVAGDFSGWQPLAMRRERDVWVLRLSLAPGLYRYAFRAADGSWFVPRSVPGRRDDGMGGHVAVLVVD